MEAHLARGFLEEKDIPCYICDEFIVGTQPLFTSAVGGVKIRVPQSHAAQAIEILSDFWEQRRMQAERLAKQCPQCQSQDVRNNPLSLVLIILALLTIGLAWLFLVRKRKCLKCGFVW